MGFLANLIVTALVFVSLMQLFDVLSNADDIVKRHGSSIAAVLKHIGLKTPEIAVAAVPFSVLIAALLVLARLANNNEVLALKASGVSYYQLLFAFAPAALVVAVFYFFLCDQLAPAAERAFDSWEAQAKAQMIRPEKTDTDDDTTIGYWVRDGSSVVRVESVLDDGARLLGLSLFLLDEHDRQIAQIDAPEADYRDGVWRLPQARRVTLAGDSGGTVSMLTDWVWHTPLTPGHFADITAPAASLSSQDLLRFVSNPELGNRPVVVYQTWLNRRVAAPFGIFVMILLAAPVAQGFQRRRSLGLELTVGISLGFLFFVADGLLLALGEAGALPPLIAAWAPMALFASIGGAILVRMEGH